MTDERCADLVGSAWESTKESLERFMNGRDESTYQEYREYALCFDYVPAGTFKDISEGYWRYQMSWGGPADEIRFFGTSRDFDRAEYWFLDWGDGASIDVTNQRCVQWLFDDLKDIGAVQHAYEEAQ